MSLHCKPASLPGKHRMQVFLTSATGYVGAAVAARSASARPLGCGAGQERRAARSAYAAAAIRAVPGEPRASRKPIGTRPRAGRRGRTHGLRVFGGRRREPRAGPAGHADAVERSTAHLHVECLLARHRTRLRQRSATSSNRAMLLSRPSPRTLSCAWNGLRRSRRGTIASLFATAQRSGRLPYLARRRRQPLVLDSSRRSGRALRERSPKRAAAGVFHAVDGQPLQRAPHARARSGSLRRVCIDGERGGRGERARATHRRRDEARCRTRFTSTRARARLVAAVSQLRRKASATAYAQWCAQ